MPTKRATSRLKSCQLVVLYLLLSFRSTARAGAAEKSFNRTPISETTSPWPTSDWAVSRGR